MNAVVSLMATIAAWIMDGAQALAQPVEGFSVTIQTASLDPVAIVLGLTAGVPIAVPIVLWQYWRLNRLEGRLAERQTELDAVTEGLSTSPDGYYAWICGEESCSRRLAVLLALPRGMESAFEDVLAVFSREDADTLREAVNTLRNDGEGFFLELPLTDGPRRIRVRGQRATTPGGEASSDMIWMRDVTEGATVVDELTVSLQHQQRETSQLRTMLDGLPYPVWMRDEDLALIAVNRAYADAVDAPDPEAVIIRQAELAPDTLMREARAVAARARAAGATREETFHLVLGGARRCVSISEIPAVTGDNLLTVGTAQDFTRVEEVQTELDRHITAHAEVLERLSTAIAIYSVDTRLTFFNTAFARLWRLEREWLEGHPTFGAVLDTLRERRLLPEVVDYRAYKDEELRRFVSLIDPVETLMHLPDGRTLRRLISAHPYGGLIHTDEDVTDTLALERSFNTAMAVQRETLDHLHEGIAVFGGDGRLKLSNPAFAHLWHFSSEDLDGEPRLHDVIGRLEPFFSAEADNTASSWRENEFRLQSLTTERRPLSTRLERSDGAVLDCTSVPLPDGATLLTWLDTSDSVRVERALIERNAALAAADILQSEFIANVSMEVSKPLTSIIGFTEMLSSNYAGTLTERQSEYVRGIAEAGNALRSLVSDILDLAAIEAGQITLELNTVDIAPMVTAVMTLVRERLRERSLGCVLHCPDDIGWIVADERRLKQVMLNLIGNAIKSSPEGTTISVSAQRQGRDLILSVHGDGIEPNDPDDPGWVFPDVARPRSMDRQKSAGFGLTLVRRFIDLHGGRVGVQTGPDRGTTVTITLPTDRSEG